VSWLPATSSGGAAAPRWVPIARTLWIALLLVVWSWPAWATSADPRKPAGEQDLLVLEAYLDGEVLSESLTAYADGSHILLPLGELSRLLTLSITVRPERGQVGGFVLIGGQSFDLDASRGEVRLGGTPRSFDRQLVLVQPDDVFVSHKLLSEWLPIAFEVDLATQKLTLRPRVRLPLQERQARARAAAELRQAVAPPSDPGYERQFTSPALASVPFIDLTIGAEVKAAEGRVTGLPGFKASLTGDLLGMEGDGYVARLPDGVSEYRLALERQHPDGFLLGPLPVRTFRAGSLVLPSVAGVVRSSSNGAGIWLSNQALDQPSTFDRQSLRGPLESGWDVTLFYNDALVAYQNNSIKGEYVFEDLPLVYGQNEFRLVFTGPLGQSRVERRSFMLDQSILKPGEVVYSLGVQHASQGGRQMGLVDVGLTRILSLQAAVITKPKSEIQPAQAFQQLGLRSYLPGMIVSLQAAQDAHGGVLLSAGLKTRLGAYALEYDHVRRSGGFESEWFASGPAGVTSRHVASATGAVSFFGMPALSTKLVVQRDMTEGSGSVLDVAGRVSTVYKGTAVSNQLRVVSSQASTGNAGLLQVSRRVYGLGLTGQLNYRVARTGNPIQGLSLYLDHEWKQGTQVNATLARDSVTGRGAVVVGLNSTRERFTQSLTAGVYGRREARIGLQLFMALGRDSRTRNWFFKAAPLTGTGAASARAFVDSNLNGVLDDGEELISGAAFVVDSSGRHPNRTGKDGTARLDQLAAGRFVDVALDPNSLDDPQWKPVRAGLRLLPRPGVMELLEFPVVPTSDIEGTVCREVGGRCVGVASALVELVDQHQAVVDQVRTGSDGYYWLRQVMPGEYRLRLSPRSVGLSDVEPALTRVVQVLKRGDFISGEDFRLKERIDR